MKLNKEQLIKKVLSDQVFEVLNKKFNNKIKEEVEGIENNYEGDFETDENLNDPFE